MAFSPDGRLLATASTDKTARLWDPATGEYLRTIVSRMAVVCGVTFSPDGQLLATASMDNTAKLWDPASGEWVGTLTGHAETVYGVAFSPDGRQLGQDNTGMEPTRLHRLRILVNPPLTAGNNSKAASTCVDEFPSGNETG